MVKYTHLNRSSGQLMTDLVKGLSAAAKDKNTQPSGVKDMGETGDVVWTREDGTEQSTRLIDTNLEEARTAVSELRDVTMPALADELSEAQTDLQAKLDAANQRIDDIVVDGGGSGNFSTYSVNAPTGDGTGEGDQWFQVVNGEVKGQWRWDGAAWQAVTLTDAVIAGIDLSKLISNGNLSEVVANKMFTNIFTANKITSQQIAAGSITTEKIAAEGIVADVIQGGSFTGETFQGGTFTGGLFKTSDALPGEVYFSDDGYKDPTNGATGPGLRIIPSDTSGYASGYAPSIGPNGNGFIVSGGRDTSGTTGFSIYSPTSVQHRRVNGAKSATMAVWDQESSLVVRPDANKTTRVGVTATTAQMRTGTRDEFTLIEAAPYEATLQTRGPDYNGQVTADWESAGVSYTDDAGNGGIISTNTDFAMVQYQSKSGITNIQADSDGVWVRGTIGGKNRNYNLLETAQDSGWVNQSYPSGYSHPHGAPFSRRVMGKRTHWRGRFQKSSGKFASGVAVVLFTLPAGDRPEYTTGLVTPSAGTSLTRIEVSAGTGEVTVRPNDDTSWVQIDGLFIDN